jgi:hypothetical protein
MSQKIKEFMEQDKNITLFTRFKIFDYSYKVQLAWGTVYPTGKVIVVDINNSVSIYDDFDIFQKTMDVQGLNIKYIDNYLIKQNNSKGVH